MPQADESAAPNCWTCGFLQVGHLSDGADHCRTALHIAWSQGLPRPLSRWMIWSSTGLGPPLAQAALPVDG